MVCCYVLCYLFRAYPSLSISLARPPNVKFPKSGIPYILRSSLYSSLNIQPGLCYRIREGSVSPLNSIGDKDASSFHVCFTNRRYALSQLAYYLRMRDPFFGVKWPPTNFHSHLNLYNIPPNVLYLDGFLPSDEAANIAILV